MPLWGADFSHYDNPDTRQAVGEGFVFQTHKAGGDQDDAELAGWWARMAVYRSPDFGPVLLGSYWVLRPDTAGTATGKADRFLAILDANCPGWRNGPFILQIDAEKWNGDAGTVPNLAYIHAFCDRLVAKTPKLRPIVYGPRWVYGDKLTGLRYPLWASAYVSGSGFAAALYPGDTSTYWASYSGIAPTVLQFSSSAVIGGQTTSDADAFRGSLYQLAAIVAPGWADTMATISTADAQAIAQAVATKLHVDYGNPISGLAKDQAAAEARITAAVTAVVGALQPALVAAIQAAVAAIPPGPAVTEDVAAAALRDVLIQGVGGTVAHPAGLTPGANYTYTRAGTAETVDDIDARTAAARQAHLDRGP